MSSQPLLYKYVKEDQPELYARIKEAVAAGQWQPEGGMWVEADCNLSSGESLVRQFLHGGVRLIGYHRAFLSPGAQCGDEFRDPLVGSGVFVAVGGIIGFEIRQDSVDLLRRQTGSDRIMLRADLLQVLP